MGLFEKADAAGDAERYVPARQLQLQLQRMEMGTVKHRHFVQIDAPLAQFQHPLGNERGLLPSLTAGDHHRLGTLLARRGEFLGELAHVCLNRSIGNGQNLRGAPVVGLNLEDLRFRIALRKLKDVLKIGPAPGVDALGIVPQLPLHAGASLPAGRLFLPGFCSYPGIHPRARTRIDADIPPERRHGRSTAAATR
jgi:hypothetical protein